MWWWRTGPDRESLENPTAGNTYCQPQDLAALGHLTASDVRNVSTSFLPSSAGVALAVKVDVSFHPLSVCALGTQAVVLQPDTIAKLIEQPGRPGHRRTGRRSVHAQAQLIGDGERYES